MFKLFLILIFFMNNSFAQYSFPQENNTTTEKSQAVYESGGENTKYRVAETEKGLDFVKRELATLKVQVEDLKKQVSELQNKKEAPYRYVPASTNTPIPRPTVY